MKKGFTLIELLAVIAILAVIMLIATPKVLDAIENSKQKAYDTNVAMFQDAAINYIAATPNLVDQAEVVVTLETLVLNKFIAPIKSPWTRENCDEILSTLIATKLEDGSYNFVTSLVCPKDSNGNADQDNDLAPDAMELVAGTNPNGNVVDTDGDGLYDDYEAAVSHTSVVDIDTDYDGIDDKTEVDNGTNPLEYIDSEKGTLEYRADLSAYLIGSREDLIQLDKDVNNLTGDLGLYQLSYKYILVADIDMGTCEEVGGVYTSCEYDVDGDPSNGNFIPIGNVTTSFTGYFDGNNHTISNIIIKQPTTDYTGLFGYTTSATIRDITIDSLVVNSKSYVGMIGQAYRSYLYNIKIKNSDISGVSSVGALAGRTYSSISTKAKYIIGEQNTITGTSNNIGGLIGYTDTDSLDLSNSISNADVTGVDYVGGLVGYLRDSSVKGAVTGGSVTGTGSNVKRALGYTYLASFEVMSLDSVLLNGATVTGTAITSTYGKDIKAEDLKYTATFYEIHFDNAVAGDADTDGYYWVERNNSIEVNQTKYNPLIFDLEGSGTEADPYLVADAFEFKEINQNLYKYYKLTADIDFGGRTIYAIGHNTMAFSGHLDGNNHTISNMVINQPGTDYTGLFGYVSGSKIRDITIDNLDLTGKSYVGLIGQTYNADLYNIKIKNSNIAGERNVGGLAGRTYSTIVTYAKYIIGDQNTVTGTSNYVGGLIGYTDSDSLNLSNAISNADVTGVDYVGGLIGYLNDSTAKGAVTGGSVTGTGSNVKRALGKPNLASFELMSLDSVLLNGATVTGTTITSTYGKDIKAEDLKYTTTFYEIHFDNAVAGDADTDGYYWTEGSNIIEVAQTESSPLTFDLAGAGTEADPYLVADANDFKQIKLQLNKYYKLTADIDFAGSTIYAIGHNTMVFSGHLDGNNHTISNMVINQPGTDYTGLFGYVSGSKIRDITIDNLDLTGKSYVGLIGQTYNADLYNIKIKNSDISGVSSVGALAGRTYSSITTYAKYIVGDQNTVTGTSNYVGGLIGYTDNDSLNLSNAISNADVTGVDYVGGLIGYLSDSTAKGAVTGGSITGTGSYVKRALGRTNLASFEFMALDSVPVNGITVTSTGVTSTAGKDIKAGDLKYTATYYDIHFDNAVAGDADTDGYYWTEGSNIIEVAQTESSPLIFDLAGAGTEADPYLVADANDFKQIKLQLNKYYKLTADIDFAGSTIYAIGHNTMGFTGHLDGNNHTISNMVINQPGTDYTGLFGYITSATIRDITIDNLEVTGKSYVGLIGQTYNADLYNIKIKNSDISGVSSVGALAGRTYSSITTYAKYIVGDQNTVTGTSNYVGGLIGYTDTDSLNLTNSVSNADVTGLGYVGGLVGYLRDSTAKGVVTGGSITGTGSYVKRALGYTYLASFETMALDSILVNGSTVTSTTVASTQGKNITLAESQDINTYTQISFDINSDSDADGYWWTMVSNNLTVNN